MSEELRRNYFILLSLSPLIAFVVHFIFARVVQIFRIQIAPLAVALMAILCGYFIMATICAGAFFSHFAFDASSIIAIIYGSIVYMGLAFAYFQFFGMTEGEIAYLFPQTKLLAARIQDLIDSRLVDEKEGNLSLTLKGRMMIKPFISLRKIMGLPAGAG